jgi:hypothetical protein
VTIDRILVLPHNNIQRAIFVLTRDLKVEPRQVITSHRCGAKALHIKVCALLPYGQFSIHNADEIKTKCILMNVGDSTFLADMPNQYEKD